ncbi:hypothetical protein J6590_053123 [Homalodisca vitripennis]|nr:hypothetical protein J6590_053123 [Homalodisca vitripennis]
MHAGAEPRSCCSAIFTSYTPTDSPLPAGSLLCLVREHTNSSARSSTAIDNVITNFPNVSVSVLNTAISNHTVQETIERFHTGPEKRDRGVVWYGVGEAVIRGEGLTAAAPQSLPLSLGSELDLRAAYDYLNTC